MKTICFDLANEQQALDAIVADLDEAGWKTMTPSDGWNIKEQIRHLAYFEERARLCASNPAGFKRWLTEMLQDLKRMNAHIETTGSDLSATETLNWWREERSALLEILEKMDRKDRLPWYGPDMSAMSFATARLMETWAHGQDIVDALGVERKPTEGLRHIAHLGVSTFGWSYANRQMEVPQTPVRVELTGPSGDLWAWGPEDTKDIVKGPAEDFCLVVVQRRHVADTNLMIIGETAAQWMSITQAYAGPPGEGRKAGMFPKR
ncbi:MAG: TIGR03084 family protein [Desulfobacterales bacterium]|nr:MAG: TIGR03084 family protein [Desulfobacterales bacterium]